MSADAAAQRSPRELSPRADLAATLVDDLGASRPEAPPSAADDDDDDDDSPRSEARFGGQDSGGRLVSLEDLLHFVFPAGLQHPLSTGRLLAFGFYGPLDADAQLRSGHKGGHVVSRWELDAMCRQFEREDVLQVYILPGRPLATLSEGQQDELISQADRRVKAASGKGLMPQLLRADVSAIFDGTPRSGDGSMHFHAMQEAVMLWRDARVARLKVMYPTMGRRTAPRERAPQLRDGAASSRTAVSSRSRVRPKVTADVAPPEMFMKNAGLTDNGVATESNRMLATRAFRVCEIEQGNSAALAANVRLIRNDRSDKFVGDSWSSQSTRINDVSTKLRIINTLRHNDAFHRTNDPFDKR